MQLISYGSSSAGNCYLLSSENMSIVLDIGRNVMLLKSDPNYNDLLKASFLLISHEHIDHTLNIYQFLNFNIRAKVIINPKSLKVLLAREPRLKKYLHRFINLEHFNTYENKGNNFKVKALEVIHNSKANNGYIIEFNNKKVFFLTDCGSFRLGQLEDVNFADFDLFMIESNFAQYEDMSIRSNMEKNWKNAVQHSNQGHFSNLQATALVDWINHHSQTSIFNKVVWIHSSRWDFEYLNYWDKYGIRMHPTEITRINCG